MGYPNELGGQYHVGIINDIPDILKRDAGSPPQSVSQQPAANMDISRDAMAARFIDLFSRYAMATSGEPRNQVMRTIKKTWSGLAPEQREKLIGLYLRSSVEPRVKEFKEVVNNNPELAALINEELERNHKKVLHQNRVILGSTLLGGAVGAGIPLMLRFSKKVNPKVVGGLSFIGGALGLGVGNILGTRIAVKDMKQHPLSRIGIINKMKKENPDAFK